MSEIIKEANPGEVAGIPFISLRDFLKSRRDFSAKHLTELARALKPGATDADGLALAQQLVKAGLLQNDEDGWWSRTDAGIQYALKKAKRLSPKGVAKLKADLLARVAALATDDRFFLEIVKVVAFGSCIEQRADYGDIDVAFRYAVKPRFSTFQEGIAVWQETHKNYDDHPQTDIKRFLRNRSAFIHIQDYSWLKQNVRKSETWFEKEVAEDRIVYD